MNEILLDDLERNSINEYYVNGKCFRWNAQERRFEIKTPSISYRDFG